MPTIDSNLDGKENKPVDIDEPAMKKKAEESDTNKDTPAGTLLYNNFFLEYCYTHYLSYCIIIYISPTGQVGLGIGSWASNLTNAG